MSLYKIEAGRSDTQKAHMEDLEARGVCVFCPDHIRNEDGESVIFETPAWFVKHNSYPYKSTRLHLLAIPKQHTAELSALAPEAQAEFFTVIEQCIGKFSLASYAVVIRSGDMAHNGGSIEHLHAHIIVGDTSDPNHEPIRVKVSSQP